MSYSVRVGMPDPWHEALDSPGARDVGRLRSILAEFDFGALEPRQDLLAADDPDVRVAELPADDALLAYLPDRRELELAGEAALDGAAWLDPATGREVPAEVTGGSDRATVPAPSWSGDAVLVGEV